MSVEYIVSGCLAGLPCRYDGGSKPFKPVMKLVEIGAALPVCPETCAGLPVPRLPCEHCGKKIVDKSGMDRTNDFERGAEKALEIALASGCKKAILKAKSPSCGYGLIYDGSFNGRTAPGNGLFTEKLLAVGFEIWSELTWPHQ